MKIHKNDGNFKIDNFIKLFIRKKNDADTNYSRDSDNTVFFLKLNDSVNYGISKLIDIFNEVFEKLQEENSSLLIMVNFQELSFSKGNDKKKSILYDYFKKEMKRRNKYLLLKPSKDMDSFILFDTVGKKRTLNGFSNSIFSIKNLVKGSCKIFVGEDSILKKPHDILLLKKNGINTLILHENEIKKRDFFYFAGRSQQFDITIFSFSDKGVKLFEPKMNNEKSKYLESTYDSKKSSEVIKLFLNIEKIQYGMSFEYYKIWIELIEKVNKKMKGNCFEKSNGFNK